MYIFSSRLRQRGAFLLLAAIILPLFLLVAGACVDIGALYIAKGRQQNAADAAALAGAQELPDSDKAVAMARDYLVRNGFSQEIANSATVEILESNTKCRVTFEAPAPLVVFRAFFETGPTIRARAAAIGTKGGGYAIFADNGTSSDNHHALYISNNHTSISGNIHSNNGIGVTGALTLSPGEITCQANHANADNYSGVPAIKHIAKQPFPDRSEEIDSYKKSSRCFQSSDMAAFLQALKGGKADGIYTTGPVTLDTSDADALKNLRYIIADGIVTLTFGSATLGSSAQPVLIASLASSSILNERDAIIFRTSTTSAVTTYANFYAPNNGVDIQANNTNLTGSIAGKSVTLQLNSLKAGNGSGAGGRTLRLVE